MKLAAVVLLALISAVFAIPGKVTDLHAVDRNVAKTSLRSDDKKSVIWSVGHEKSADLKTTNRVITSWTKTGSGIATTIVVQKFAGSRLSTITMRGSSTLTQLRDQIHRILQFCALSYQQRCELRDLIRVLLDRGPNNTNVWQAMWDYWNALAVEKVNLLPQNVVDAMNEIDQIIAPGNNLQAVAWSAHQDLIANGLGGRCTYNYRECKETDGSFKHRTHHCYWAIFRCTQDMDSSNAQAVKWCGLLMQASMANHMTLG